ncbi:uncharacterized protein N7506_006968 [Penicillium brevicompactum]|uniref:uncharacterized protein n=1 Tax=Penicillium brevicompactum TaxID=5074 RepID=UPI00254037BE|nr:uncharacterized protein N7506_006968 [Penicillium brevicompactum]KAJ5333185.1 hypothetical protein N7506_006968 [Penicillium brevicompactum]
MAETKANLQANWIWVPGWIDSGDTAGKIVRFNRSVNLASRPTRSLLHFSADTRYKLYVNGKHVAVGPSRSSPLIWYYDTLDIAPYLQEGQNEIEFVVVRYFAASRSAMPFERTALPGLTVVGQIEIGDEIVDLSSKDGWTAYVNESIRFPMGLADDVFLHISERVTPTEPATAMKPVAYNMRTLNGDIPPWNLHPRVIPMPESTPIVVNTIRACESSAGASDWAAFLGGESSLVLPGNSTHKVDVQADVHSTAFLRWAFKAASGLSQLKLKVTYSEGYELEPRSYPFFRSKADRLDASVGHIIGPYDEATLDIPDTESVVYEPFWFRTFHLLRLEITIGPGPIELMSFDATQVNYPMAIKASWNQPGDAHSNQMWDVSIRTMRNCMFDGYSDCPFYEQLQYSGDSRSVGLFHYLLSGDDRLMRQAITNFAASVTPLGLTQSRFPSHVPQVIAGFSLYWILQVCDHHLYFNDTKYARGFIPRIDGVLDFFDAHIDELGLVSGMPEIVWQYVDWVTTWGATDDHPDKGVPTSGRKSNRHTYFSLLYGYVLQKSARLVRQLGRPGHATEYEDRSASVLQAVRTHCWDGQFFTDSTADIADEHAYSQHCQVFAVLAGVLDTTESARILATSLTDPEFSKCSYVMRFYAFRALSSVGNGVYEYFWERMWAPWRGMLANNLSTWEEDDVRQRSDCHAWGSVPVYEYCAEVAGLQPLEPGWSKVLFKPRLSLAETLEVSVALGSDNVASVSWKPDQAGRKLVELRLQKSVELLVQYPNEDGLKSPGVVDLVEFSVVE